MFVFAGMICINVNGIGRVMVVGIRSRRMMGGYYGYFIFLLCVRLPRCFPCTCCWTERESSEVEVELDRSFDYFRFVGFIEQRSGTGGRQDGHEGKTPKKNFLGQSEQQFLDMESLKKIELSSKLCSTFDNNSYFFFTSILI